MNLDDKIDRDDVLNDLNVKQSLQINSYIMDNTKFENKNKARVEFGILGGTTVSHVKSNLVDVENDLYGITRDATRCPDFKYMPPENNALEPIKLFKCDSTPTLNLKQEHLKAVNFFDYQEVPKEPKLRFDRCPVKGYSAFGL